MHTKSSVVGRVAAICVAVETIVFGFSLIWGLIFHSQFDQTLGYVASFFLAPTVVVMMA